MGVDSNGAALETLSNPSVDESAAKPQEESSVDDNTMSVILSPGLEPATINIPDHVKRSDFPPDFIFGASSSALQVSLPSSKLYAFIFALHFT